MVSTKWCLIHLPGSVFAGSVCPLSPALLADWAMPSSGQQSKTSNKPDGGPMQMEDFMLTPDACRISSKSQCLLVFGYLLVVTSRLFTVPPFISLVFIINYSCSYCGSSRSADSKVKALFEATPCSVVIRLQRPVEHKLERSVKIWACKSRKWLIHHFWLYFISIFQNAVVVPR